MSHDGTLSILPNYMSFLTFLVHFCPRLRFSHTLYLSVNSWLTVISWLLGGTTWDNMALWGSHVSCCHVNMTTWDNMALWAKSKETHNYIQIYSDLTSPEFGQAVVPCLPSLSICLTSHWTDAVVVHPASILDVSDGVSKPVQYHSVLMWYWFQMWKKTVVSSCNSGHSSILKLQCIVLKN